MPCVERGEIVASLVSRLVAAQFPQWAGLPVTRLEQFGWDNITFRLGSDLSVRLPSGDSYAPQVDKEHRWLPVLAPHLPLAIPQPLAKGEPGLGYPWHWSVCKWIEGEPATHEGIADLNDFAIQLADFLSALYKVDPAGGPPAGEHSFFRAGPLASYDGETRDAISAFGDEIDDDAAINLWQTALSEKWSAPPVWVHGDVASGNLLVREGRLSAVIDFGCSAVGDPACDLTIAWTFLSGESRNAFRTRIALDDETWARARGWALWKALITKTRSVIDAVLAEHRAESS